jgi:two-component system sensor histidine kinase/response regulator
LMGVNTILSASNGLQALQLLRSRRVDIILSDWNMPVMSGLELLQAVRSDPKLSHLPFIMITAETERLRIAEAIDNGVTSLLIKPYTAADLSKRLERALTPRHSAPPDAVLTVGPRRATLPSAVEPATSGAVGAARPTILVIDDSPERRVPGSGWKQWRYGIGNVPVE